MDHRLCLQWNTAREDEILNSGRARAVEKRAAIVFTPTHNEDDCPNKWCIHLGTARVGMGANFFELRKGF